MKYLAKIDARVAALVEFVQLCGGSTTTVAAKQNFPDWDDTMFYMAVKRARSRRLLRPYDPRHGCARQLMITERVEPVVRTTSGSAAPLALQGGA